MLSRPPIWSRLVKGHQASQRRGVATLIKGQDAAKKIMSQVSQDLQFLQKAGVQPKLVPVVVGDVAESRIYLDNKRKSAIKHGLA